MRVLVLYQVRIQVQPIYRRRNFHGCDRVVVFYELKNKKKNV